MKTTSLARRLSASVITGLLLSASLTHAASYKWDFDSNALTGTPPTATPGSGTWNTSLTNWTLSNVSASWVNGSGNDAQFGGSGGATGTYAVTVGSSVTSASAITFVTSGFTLSSTAAQTLTATSVSVASGVTATIGSNLTISGATLGTMSSGGTLILKGGTASTATGTNFTINGGTGFMVKVESAGLLSSGSSILVGTSGSTGAATLQVDGGNVTTAGSNATLILGNSAGTSVVTLNSGTINLSGSGGTNSQVRYGPGTLASGTVTGTLNLNGGTLTTSKVGEGTSTGGVINSTFNFNGGVLKVKTDTSTASTFMTGLDTANVRNGGAIFDTNGINITVSQALIHSTIDGDNAKDGGLTKRGTGILTLTGANTFTGNLALEGGTLSLGSIFIGDTANVSFLTGAVLNLTYNGTDTIAGLFINGTEQAVGTWGSLTSLADHKSAFFTGSGILNVTGAVIPEPSTYAALAGAAALSLVVLRRRRHPCAC